MLYEQIRVTIHVSENINERIYIYPGTACEKVLRVCLNQTQAFHLPYTVMYTEPPCLVIAKIDTCLIMHHTFNKAS